MIRPLTGSFERPSAQEPAIRCVQSPGSYHAQEPASSSTAPRLLPLRPSASKQCVRHPPATHSPHSRWGLAGLPHVGNQGEYRGGKPPLTGVWGCPPDSPPRAVPPPPLQVRPHVLQYPCPRPLLLRRGPPSPTVNQPRTPSPDSPKKKKPQTTNNQAGEL